MKNIKNKPQLVAIILTAVSAMPVYQAFSNLPLILAAVVLLGIGYVLSASHLGRSGPQTALALPVYGGCSLLFGLFASFQLWRILAKVIEWFDSILTTFFQWIQI